MLRQVTIPFEELQKAVTSFMTWGYTGSAVLDDMKKVYFRVLPAQLEMAIMTPELTVRTMIQCQTYEVNSEWAFIVEFKDLKELVDTYAKLSCTIISTCTFEELEVGGVSLILHEQPKDGFGLEYTQDQKYKFLNKTKVDVSKVFDNRGVPKTIKPMNISAVTQALNVLGGKIVKSKLQAEDNLLFVFEGSCVYGHMNPEPDLFVHNMTLGKSSVSFLRLLLKYCQSKSLELSFGHLDTALCLFYGTSVVYMAKGVVRKSCAPILVRGQVAFSVELVAGYFKDILRRFSKVDENIRVSFYADNNRAYFSGGGITQYMAVPNVPKEADNKTIFIEPKRFIQMILTETENIRLTFVEKKGGRASEKYYLCYVEQAQDSDWLSVIHVERGM
jgi:hypothetical protein